MSKFVDKVLVRITEDELIIIEAIQSDNPGVAKAEALRIALRNHSVVGFKDIMMKYRKAPLFRDWMIVGPMFPEYAQDRADKMIQRGFEVEVYQKHSNGEQDDSIMKKAESWPVGIVTNYGDTVSSLRDENTGEQELTKPDGTIITACLGDYRQWDQQPLPRFEPIRFSATKENK